MFYQMLIQQLISSYGQVLVYENVGGVGRWRPNDYTTASRISGNLS